jgi:hypothetical protein
MGTFRITLEAEGSETEEEVNASKIKKFRVRFFESNELKQEMQKAEVVALASLMKK